MGDFTLGCLLGQYDGGQSFEVDSVALGATLPSSWGKRTGQSSNYLLNNPISQVHRSPQSLRVEVHSSTAAFGIWYRYGYEDDAYARWFPDVTCHDVRVDFWGGAWLNPDSGEMTATLYSPDHGNAQAVLARYTPPRHHRLATTVQSKAADTPSFLVNKRTTSDSTYMAVFDSILPQIDPVTLHPEHSLQEASALNEARHRSRSGLLYNYVWSRHFAWRVPLRFLPDSHADLINWWWERRFNLVLTLDTSDSESLHIVRIANERQPIGRRVRPYDNLWEGALELESINEGALVY